MGVALAIVLVTASVLVVITFPLDFGPSRWSNPAVWADFPKAVPPAWTAALSADAVPHQIVEASEPTETTERGTARVETYDLAFDYDAKEPPPTFLSFSLGEVTYAERPPTLSVTLLRPDGTQVPLLRTTIRGPRPGEEGPPFRRTTRRRCECC